VEQVEQAKRKQHAQLIACVVCKSHMTNSKQNKRFEPVCNFCESYSVLQIQYDEHSNHTCQQHYRSCNICRRAWRHKPRHYESASPSAFLCIQAVVKDFFVVFDARQTGILQTTSHSIYFCCIFCKQLELRKVVALMRLEKTFVFISEKNKIVKYNMRSFC
jgi:hypothetical protein